MAFSSPRLSYLPSDVEEDLGIIDFDEPQYDFLGKAEFFLFEDIPADHPLVYDKSAAWLCSVFEPKDHDPYFDVQSVNITPVNGLSRFDYLSRSGGRFNTATITRRKNDNVENDAPKALTPQIGTRFGTITKRSIQLNDSTNSGSDSDRGNRTFEFPRKNSGNLTFTASSSIYENTPPHPPILTDPMGNRTVPSLNTNTITKNRRSYTVRQVNEQLNHFSHQQTEDDISVQSVANTDSSGSRNYPTISRNETRSIVHPQRYTNSNDDLASDSSSAISVVSNLSMTSSVSQPSLPHSLSLAQLNNNGVRKPMATRSGLLNNNISNMSGSRLCRPSSQNGIPSRQTTYTKLPNSGATFGSTGNGIGSMQQQPLGNMARTSSQTIICEDSSGISSTSSQLLSQLSSPALSRNSTFRVHRPSPIPSVATVFAAGAGLTSGQPVANSVTNGRSNSSLKYNSDDNLLNTSQEEIDQFRAKVLNSSNGNLRSIHAYQQGLPQPTNGNYQNRADSPSSNSSSCSSNSSASRLKFAPNGNSMSLANRLNNNHYQPGSTDSSNSACFDAKTISLKGYNSHNLNSSLASNNNNSLCGFAAIGGERNGSSLSTTSYKSAQSRIPAMPKATNTPNRSAIPVSGTIPRQKGASHCEAQAKKTKLTSAFPATNKIGSPQTHHLIANKRIDDNSWQNDCF